MTERIYYLDAAARSFDAVVRSCAEAGGAVHVVLDRTAFYPTSGGQPFDTGRLDGVEVVDVIDRDDGDIAHVVTAPLPVGATVHGEIDWERRVDHMQQHSGQHVLSAMFERACGVRTVSFHLGAAASTIDLDREVATDEIARAETSANQVIWDDRPVSVRIVDADEAARLPLRGAPKRAGAIRLVEIDGVDLSACGGTHVARTGGIGQIVVSASERFKGGTRVTFLCGGRALVAHQTMRRTVQEARRILGAADGDIAAQIERLQAVSRERERRMNELAGTVTGYRAAHWRREAETIGTLRGVLRQDPSADAAGLAELARAIVDDDADLVAILAGAGEPLPVVVARSARVGVDAAELVRAVTTAFGGRGGGRPELARAGVSASADRVFTFARDWLRAKGT